MFIGIAIFWIGMKNYAHADVLKPAKPEDMQLGRIVAVILLPSIAFAAIGYFIPYVLIKSKSTDAFMFACIPIVYYYISLYTKAEATEKKPIAAMLAIFAVSIAFWAVFKQNGAALTTWADKYTDRAVPAAVLAPAQALYLTKDISAKSDSVANLDAQFRKIDDTKIVGQDSYFKNLPAEQMPTGEGKVTVFATNLFQSINPGWVILLTPVVVGFFGLMRSRRREPSTPTKIFYGLLISALSMFCMLGAVIAGSNGAEKVSPLWLFATYGVLTIGELCLSPMGLSLVSKLAPPRLVSVMMGGWFLATSIGNKLAGVLSSLWDTYDDKRLPWLLNMALLGAAALIIFSMLKWLRGIFSNY
jgi:POT family proton-dependent oligopeptide transporter